MYLGERYQEWWYNRIAAIASSELVRAPLSSQPFRVLNGVRNPSAYGFCCLFCCPFSENKCGLRRRQTFETYCRAASKVLTAGKEALKAPFISKEEVKYDGY